MYSLHETSHACLTGGTDQSKVGCQFASVNVWFHKKIYSCF